MNNTSNIRILNMASVKNLPLLLLLLFLINGCSNQVSLLNVGAQGRRTYDDTFVFSGGLSSKTVNLLGNHLLNSKMTDAPEQFIRDLEKLYQNDPSPQTMVAIAETSQVIAGQMRNDPDTAVRYDLTTIIYTNLYFQDMLSGKSSLLFDPEIIVAVKCYNLALTELFAYLRERNLHCAGGFELSAAGGQSIYFVMPKYSLPVDKEKIEYFQLCSDFRPQNLTHDSRNFGIGVPLICDLDDNAIPETVFAEGQVIPATLAARVQHQEQHDPRLELQLFYLDSRSSNEINVNDFILPLAQDFSTPLAYMVHKPQVFNFIQRTFQIDLTRQAEGLYHLEPHNDDRIPIVLVHGLMSDIRTWLQLINTLQSDPELRKNYRFMGFSYSSGNPIFVTAMHLRKALHEERERLLKDGRNLKKFDQMVLIGHSMGGLVSRLMISESNEGLLRNFIGEEVYSNSIDHDDVKFREMLIFNPVSSVKRVIFIAVPHRGSELAQRWFAHIASSMIKIPQSLIEFNTKLLSNLIDISDQERKELVGKFNGIDNLSPDGNALKLLNTMPMANIPYHSVIGNKYKSGVPGGSDGVVPYSSSHLNGAKSEIVVHSGHSVQQNPLAIQEIKRILKEHLKNSEK